MSNNTTSCKDKEQTTKATIGNGTINVGVSSYNKETITDETTGEQTTTLVAVGGDSNSDLIRGLNRDVNKSQEITKDETKDGWNIDVDVNVGAVVDMAKAGGVKNYAKGEGEKLKGNTKELAQKTDRVVENIYDVAEKVPGGEFIAKATIGSTVGGLASAFGEDSRTEDKYVVNGKSYDTWDEAVAENPDINTFIIWEVLELV